jgi:hypothetical protein
MRFIELNESRGTFRLHPAFDPKNYVMTDSLRDVRNWRAMTYAGNSIGRDGPKIGEMGPVEYVMISKIDNTIIPISRSDEHHCGRDMLYEIGVNDDDFIPIFADGNNYIYFEEDIPDMVNVLRKFLSYGGIDGYLKGANSLTGFVMTLSGFVNSDGNVNINPGELASTGKKIISEYKKLVDACDIARADPERVSLLGTAKQQAKRVVGTVRDISYLMGVSVTKTDVIDACSSVDELEQVMFGFKSLKNDMHNALRKAKKESKSYDHEIMSRLWGDIDLAIDILGRF